MKVNYQNTEKVLECANCNYKTSETDWLSQERYQLKSFNFPDEKFEESIIGDHVRCPKCNDNININYDLFDVDEPNKVKI